MTRAPRATRAVVVAWSLWALAMLGLAALAWFDHLLRRVGRADLAPLGTSDAAPYVVAVLSSATVGAVLGSRRPRHPVGWLLLALGLSVVASGVAIGYASYALLARPGALPAAVWPAAYTDFSVVLWAACLGFILLLTPTGSLPSPRWRWWATVTVAAAAVAVVSTTLLPFDEPFRAVANPLAVDALNASCEWLRVLVEMGHGQVS